MVINTKKKHKKKNFIYIFLVLIILLGTFFYFKNDNPEVINKTINKVIFHKLDCTIIYKNNESFTCMKNENDAIYQFNKKIEYNQNENVEIKYTGSLDDTKKYQDITIHSIKRINFQNSYSENVNTLLNNMTPEEKIGQLLLVRVPQKDKIKVINQYHLGGYIIFRRDLMDKDADELKKYIQDFQNEAKIPLLIAIDEEGGLVSRLSTNPKLVKEPYKSSQELYELGGYDLIKEDQINKSKYLNDLGINVNLSPVADTCTNKDAYIYERSFGKNAKETAKFVETIYETQTKEVSYVLKHFPGYGNNVDTHSGISTDNRSLKELKENDFLPFQTGIKNGAMAILVAHNIMTEIDDKPASLSINIHNILRNDLNFNGIIITDDLSMDAIKEYETVSPYVDAVLSGNNIIIVTDFIDAYNDILKAYNEGIISDELLNHLVAKVLWFKEQKGLI